MFLSTFKKSYKNTLIFWKIKMDLSVCFVWYLLRQKKIVFCKKVKNSFKNTIQPYSCVILRLQEVVPLWIRRNSRVIQRWCRRQRRLATLLSLQRIKLCQKQCTAIDRQGWRRTPSFSLGRGVRGSPRQWRHDRSRRAWLVVLILQKLDMFVRRWHN